jgi:hypothetical protein
MFNFETAENLTNKKGLQLAELKVFAGNKIRLSEDALTKLAYDDNSRIHILQDMSGALAIGTVPSIIDGEPNKEGRPLNSSREFSHQLIAHKLGGACSEWKLTGEAITNPNTNRVWFVLSETLNGASERARIEELKQKTDVKDVDNSTETIYDTVENVQPPHYETESESGVSFNS